MNTLRRLALLSATFATLGGCYFPATLRPAVSGQVIAAKSKEPIDGATVTVKFESYALYRTDWQGRFSIPARKQWMFFFAPMDRAVNSSTLVVGKYGWQTSELPITGNRPIKDVLVELRLNPGMPAPAPLPSPTP